MWDHPNIRITTVSAVVKYCKHYIVANSLAEYKNANMSHDHFMIRRSAAGQMRSAVERGIVAGKGDSASRPLKGTARTWQLSQEWLTRRWWSQEGPSTVVQRQPLDQGQSWHSAVVCAAVHVVRSQW